MIQNLFKIIFLIILNSCITIDYGLQNQKTRRFFKRAFVCLKKRRIFATAFEKRSNSSAGRAHPF